MAGIKAGQLKDGVMEVFYKVRGKGGFPVSFICDNCPLNQCAYALLGGPGEVHLGPDGHNAFLVYDYDHIFKNIRNNWITEPAKKLAFSTNDIQYVACWNDVATLFNEDKKNAIRPTKLMYISVNPKPLQRQNIDLVCQVFNDKTCAALSSLSQQLNFSEGTVILISLMLQWYRMMSVKSRYSSSRLNDEYRKPCSKDCSSFKDLSDICDVISTCSWPAHRGRMKKLTRFTADAFIVTTKFNIAASKQLHEMHNFQYVLPAVFSQSPPEFYFGQASQRRGGGQLLHRPMRCYSSNRSTTSSSTY